MGFEEMLMMLMLVLHLGSLKDDDLAGKMGLQPKELNKVIATLANDCLVKVYVSFSVPAE